MYWDVVEAVPEPNYSLFVHFKDGVAGHIELEPEQLTGALAPLLDAQFFNRVYIDYGAVAWPGEIDLAPDAMYAQIAGERQPGGYLDRRAGATLRNGTRYDESMTGLLAEALRRVESLSAKEQDAIASQIIETLNDEEDWNRSFSGDPSVLRSFAREALEEHRRGETRPLDETIG